MIKNIVFDMGRVLLDYDEMPACRECTDNESDAQDIAQALFESKYWPMTDLGAITDQEAADGAKKLLHNPGLSNNLQRCMEIWHHYNLWPHKGTDMVVEAMRQRGKSLYILSNASHRFREYQCLIPHLDYFSGIMVSAEEGLVKPDERIYHRLYSKFNIDPTESVFIDDVPENVEAAVKTGMLGYCFKDGNTDKLMEYLNNTAL